MDRRTYDQITYVLLEIQPSQLDGGVQAFVGQCTKEYGQEVWVTELRSKTQRENASCVS